jgi:hypothetical protein
MSSKLKKKKKPQTTLTNTVMNAKGYDKHSGVMQVKFATLIPTYEVSD